MVSSTGASFRRKETEVFWSGQVRFCKCFGGQVGSKKRVNDNLCQGLHRGFFGPKKTELLRKRVAPSWAIAKGPFGLLPVFIGRDPRGFFCGFVAISFQREIAYELQPRRRDTVTRSWRLRERRAFYRGKRGFPVIDMSYNSKIPYLRLVYHSAILSWTVLGFSLTFTIAMFAVPKTYSSIKGLKKTTFLIHLGYFVYPVRW